MHYLILALLFFYRAGVFSELYNDSIGIYRQEERSSIVLATKRLIFPSYPNAFNPSLALTNFGLLLTFRYIPEPETPWISQVGIVRLDEESLEPLSAPQLLQFPSEKRKTPCQAEDARIFHYNAKTYILYNDNTEIINSSEKARRDMFIAQLQEIEHSFVLSEPVKLFSHDHYQEVTCQKNWVPFDWYGHMLLCYSIDPHEILYPNFENGKCTLIAQSKIFNHWKFGKLRGGTPALMVDGEYLSFFHSSKKMYSVVSTDCSRFHYFIGAYAFCAEPPFKITKITPIPIVAKGFYRQSTAEKRVIFPGGFFIKDPYLHVAYGKDDQEIWIATIDKDLLKATMVPVQECIDDNKILTEIFEITHE